MKTPGEWTVLDDGYIQCGERKFYVGSLISGEIVSTHNAALAAEQEIKSAEKQILLDEIAKNQQLREQLAAAQKQINMDTECIERIRSRGMKMELERDQAVEALKEFENEYPHVTRLLAKIGSTNG